MVSLLLEEISSPTTKLKTKQKENETKDDEENLFNFGDIVLTNFINKETIISEMENIFDIDDVIDGIKYIKPTFIDIEPRSK